MKRATDLSVGIEGALVLRQRERNEGDVVVVQGSVHAPDLVRTGGELHHPGGGDGQSNQSSLREYVGFVTVL